LPKRLSVWLFIALERGRIAGHQKVGTAPDFYFRIPNKKTKIPNNMSAKRTLHGVLTDSQILWFESSKISGRSFSIQELRASIGVLKTLTPPPALHPSFFSFSDEKMLLDGKPFETKLLEIIY